MSALSRSTTLSESARMTLDARQVPGREVEALVARRRATIRTRPADLEVAQDAQRGPSSGSPRGRRRRRPGWRRRRAWRSARRGARGASSCAAGAGRSERGCGPKTTPPPAKCGARREPWRARPVPFWRYGFLPPPATSPRVFVSLGAQAAAGQLGGHDLVEDGRVDRRGEELVGELHRCRSPRPSGRRGSSAASSGLLHEDQRVAAPRARTPSRGGGCARRPRARPGSFLTVTRSSPMWPAMRMPL